MQNEIYDEKNGLTYMLCGDPAWRYSCGCCFVLE